MAQTWYTQIPKGRYQRGTISDMQTITSSFEWKGETIQCEWNRMKSFDGISPVTQVYGICFNTDGEILIGRKGSSWNLPGGTPEGEETFIETLKRECAEEVNIEIKNILPLGAQKTFNSKTPDIVQYQLRCVCQIVTMLPEAPDPDDGIIWERRFIPIEEANSYLNWGEIGTAIFAEAMVLHKKNAQI